MRNPYRSRHALRMFSPEEWANLSRMRRLARAHPGAEDEMRRFAEAAFERGLFPSFGLENHALVVWDHPGLEP